MAKFNLTEDFQLAVVAIRALLEQSHGQPDLQARAQKALTSFEPLVKIECCLDHDETGEHAIVADSSAHWAKTSLDVNDNPDYIEARWSTDYGDPDETIACGMAALCAGLVIRARNLDNQRQADARAAVARG